MPRKYPAEIRRQVIELARSGTKIAQLSRALGHHSPAFTLTRYTHLLPGDCAPAIEVLRISRR